MKGHGTSDSELFRVDRPKEALKALCSCANGLFYWEEIKKEYEKETNLKVSEDTARNILYFFAQFELCEKVRDQLKYRISDLGKQVCDALHSENRLKYQRAIARVLLGQELKSKLFSEFVNFLKEPRASDAISRKFGRKGSTLVAWCKEGGLVFERDGLLYARGATIRTVEEFWEALNQAYHKASRTSLPSVKSMFVKISDIYHELLPLLDPFDNDAFDNFMGKILKAQRFSKRIELSGAPVSYVEEKKLRPLSFRNRRYYYLALISPL